MEAGGNQTRQRKGKQMNTTVTKPRFSRVKYGSATLDHKGFWYQVFEQARSNIIAAHEEIEAERLEVVDALGAAIERVRSAKARPETAQDKPTDPERNRHSRVATLADLLRESAQESE